MSEQADYGVDAPTVVRNLILGGIAGIAVGWIGAHLSLLPAWAQLIIAWVGGAVGIICFLEALYCYWSSKVGKLRQREILLDELQLKGDEQLLDVGCGRGLLLIGAAKRLPRGRAVGIDLWQAEDLSNNSADATMANAQREGVSERVEVVTGDMRKMPFATDSFDVVISSMVIHNVYTPGERQQALSEVYRVLKPGGRFRIQDFRHTKDYVEVLTGLGAKEVTRSSPVFNVYGARIVSGTK